MLIIGSFVCFFLAVGQSAKAAADTCTWTGSGGDSNINTAGNWSGCDNGTVPQSGDNLVFPTGPTNKTVTINTALEFNTVTFSGDDYTVETTDLGTNLLFVDNNLTISGDDNTFNPYVRFFDSSSVTLAHSGSGNVFSHYIVIQPTADNADVIFDIDSDMSVPMIAQTAVGVGSSVDTVTKTGVGTLDITGAGITGLTANNGIHIEEGTWKCDSQHCLGNDANEIILDNGSDPDGPTLHLNGNDTVPNPITTNTGAGENSSVSISADITLSGDITVTDSLNMFVTGSTSANIDSDIAIADGKNLVSYGSEGYATNAYDYGGIISGDGDLIVDNAHVTLSGASNTYTGSTELNNAALLTVTNNNSQGAQTSGTIVNSGTTLEFDSASNIGFGEPITVSGTGLGGSYPGALVKTGQNMQIEGGITLAGDTTMHNGSSELFEVTSVITGAYNLTLTNVEDDGGFNFQPGAENNFGNLIATGTELTLTGSGHTAITNNLTINAVDGKSSYVQLNSDNVIADDSVITLNNDSTEIAKLISNGVVDSVGTIIGDGTISMLDSDSRFNIGYGDITGTFEGVVEGYTNSQFQIINGEWTFAGDNTDVGNGFSSYYVSGGTLIADAINTSLGFSPFSISSGVLSGTGVIGQVSAYAGTIAPGNSPGCLNPDGDVAFTEFSTLSVQIEGTDPCTGYDFLSASGAIALNDAQLVVELPDDYVSHYGDEFMIVQGSVLAGTFAGLADGDTVTVGDHSFRINYTSREVILTDITTDTSASSSSSDSLANTGANIQMLVVIGMILITSAGTTGSSIRKIRL